MDNLEVLNGLRLTRAVISDPAHWTQHTSVRYKDVGGMEPMKPVSYCLTGAAAAICDGDRDLFHKIGLYLSQSLTGEREVSAWQCVPSFNDTHTHEEVIEFLDQQIALLEEQHVQEIEEAPRTTEHGSDLRNDCDAVVALPDVEGSMAVSQGQRRGH